LPAPNFPTQKRRDQNRISQRAFRLRKERHTMELEAKVEEMETLLETASRENSMAASRMNKMEGELLYYRGLLSGAANQRNSFITSYPGGEYRSSSSQYATSGDVAAYGTVPSYSYAPAIPSLVAPTLASEYQRAGSYDSSSTGSDSPAGEAPLEYSRPAGDPRSSPPQRNVDSAMWAYLQFNTAEPAGDDGSYRE
jgi:hypothetical protein